MGQRGRDGRLRAEDDRLGGHQTTGRVLAVGEEPAHVPRLVRLHELEELRRLLDRELAEEVRGVVGLHGVQDVGGTLDAEAGEDRDLVVLRELLEDVRESLVGQRGGDLDHPRVAEVVQHVGEVGGLGVLVGGQQELRTLLLGAGREAPHVPRLDQHGLTAPPQPQPGLARLLAPDEQLGDQPVAVALLLHADVHDGGRAGAVEELDVPVEQLADRQRLGRPLLEAPHVDQAGADDRTGVHARHPREGQEHPAAAGDLHDEPDGARRALGPQEHDDVAHPADLVAQRVEHRGPGQARGEDPRRAHAASLVTRCPPARS